VKDPYKLTLILDAASMKLKTLNEVYEEFFFQNSDELFQLIKVIEYIADMKAKKYPKDDQ